MKKIKLNSIPTHAVEKIDKDFVKKDLEKLKLKLEELQYLMYAEHKHALLVVLQGMDASGKDGAIKNVFDAVNPQGCRVISFKEPTLPEQNHDFLWRIHQHVPEKGMICVFNRSHYEDVLVERVHHMVSNKVIKQRFDQINDFEKLLLETGTHVLKFYLHVSKAEQMKRLKERLSDPAKSWKYNEGDLKERKLWKSYMRAYEDVFENCSLHTPWYIIPADHNRYKEYMIAKRIVETLKGLNMKFPKLKVD
ncbi:hypothetical protein BH11BAC1_BH11BAC1_22460 [soil metagenome]